MVKRKTLYSGGEVEVGVRSSYDLHVGLNSECGCYLEFKPGVQTQLVG